MKTILQLLADETNVTILQLLKVEPTYPRRLAAVLGKQEQKVVPRLKGMERAGLVRSRWGRVAGKNVKVYEASIDKLELAMGVEGLKVEFHSVAKRQSLSPPLYLPPKLGRASNFVGRADELRRMSSGSNFTVLEGIAGIGKTSLLQAFVGTLAPETPIFWHTFKETDSFSHVVAKLATFLEQADFIDLLDYIRGEGNDDSLKLDLLARGLDRKGWVAIFDDCHNPQDEKIDLMLQHLQRNLSMARVILASRVRPGFLLSSPEVTEIVMDGLSKADSCELMRGRKVDLSDSQLELVHRRTSGLPLALNLLSSILEKNPDKSDELLRKLPIGAMIEELLHSLNEEEKNLLFTLSVFRNPIPFDGIVHVTKVRGIRYVLQKLQRRMILKQDEDNYVLHEIIREGCYEFVDFPKQLHVKVGEWYLTREGTQEALEGLYHLSRSAQWARVGEVLSQDLFGERYHFVEEGFSNPLLRILDGAQTEALSPELVCAILCVKAHALAEAREWGKATSVLRQARAVAKKIKDPKYMGYAHVITGKNFVIQGDLRSAEASFLKAVGLLGKGYIDDSLARLQLELARISFVQGNVNEAMRYMDSGSLSG